jgi:hypothetical protein
MNERIKLLAEQAGIPSLWTVGTDKQGNPILEKFAELIIEECAKLAEYQGYNQAFGLGGLRTKLHEHFGVEE